MRQKYNKWGSGFSKHNYSKFPRKNKKSSYQWSETDLVKSIEHAKTSAAADEVQEYKPINSFDSFALNHKLRQNIINKHYKNPSPVQDTAIPHILNGLDLIGIANTGTGKTAAFLIPLIDKVCKNNSQKVLIITPTRELAEQIFNDFKTLAYTTNVYSALIIGGNGMNRQIAQLKQNPNFVIGTPGRLKDMIKRKYLHLSIFNNVVLDETDRMVDIGFVNEIKMFISMLPTTRQSLFFSATISPKVQEIINSFVQNPKVVNVKKSENLKNIKQEIIRVPINKNKIDILHNLLTQEEFNKVIVFGNAKWSVQKLSDELVRRGLKADTIHGNKRQSQRRNTLLKFKRNEINVLFATDVASRGLDISNVSHVINYELPKTYEDYLHRIGRTGRAHKPGNALTFISC